MWFYLVSLGFKELSFTLLIWSRGNIRGQNEKDLLSRELVMVFKFLKVF